MLELIKLVTRSMAFHFQIQKMIVDVQELISSYSPNEISLFKHSVDVEMSLEAIESKRFKGFGV